MVRIPQLCDNHRGISLLSIAGKVLAKVLLNRLNEHLEQSGLLPESQCGFRKDRGTIDMIFTARQLQEKCQEQNMDLDMIFVDLTKAVDTGSREALWKISNGEAVPRWYACTDPKRWWVFWSIPCAKWCQARLCTSPNFVQHDVLCHTHSCFLGWWQWHTY